MLQGAKICNLAAAIWRAILNINYLLTKVCLNTVITFTKNYWILPIRIQMLPSKM